MPGVQIGLIGSDQAAIEKIGVETWIGAELERNKVGRTEAKTPSFLF